MAKVFRTEAMTLWSIRIENLIFSLYNSSHSYTWHLLLALFGFTWYSYNWDGSMLERAFQMNHQSEDGFQRELWISPSACDFANRQRRWSMGTKGAAPPALEEWGQGCKSALFVLSTDVIFTISSYIRFSLRFDILLSSGFHDLPRNSAMVGGSIFLWKVALKFKFWRHYHVMITASALLQTPVRPALLLILRPCQ